MNRHVQAEFRDREPIPAPPRRINVGKYVALAIGGAAIVFAALWIPLKTDLLKNTGAANLNPFAAKEAGKYEARKVSVPVISMDDFIDQSSAGNTIAETTSENTQNTTVPAVETPVAEPESTAVAVAAPQPLTNGNYHIVAGCFMVQENAQRYVEQLGASNVSASIVGQNKAGLYVVSVGSYSSKEEALINLASARSISPEAWLFEN